MAKAGRSGPIITQKTFWEMAHKHHGILSFMATDWGVSRTAITKFRQKNKDYCDKVLQLTREEMMDTAENNIFKEIRKGNVQESKWYLEKFGKERGYGNKVELTHSGQPMQIEFSFKPPMEFIPHKNPALLEDDEKNRTSNNE